MKIGCCKDATYRGRSWNPAQSKFGNEDKAYGGHGHAFDRIFYAGAMYAQAFLVGQPRVFSEGVSFSLSDHFAIMGFLDVHSSHHPGRQAAEACRDRRGALTSLRDQSCLNEQVIITEMSKAGRQQAPLQWARADAERAAAALKASRAVVKERRQRRDQLWEKAFGPQSLFKIAGVSGTSYVKAAEVLADADNGAQQPPMDAIAGLRIPIECGLLAVKHHGSVNAVVQVLLRSKPVLAWLCKHSDCGKIGCVACALRMVLR